MDNKYEWILPSVLKILNINFFIDLSKQKLFLNGN